VSDECKCIPEKISMDHTRFWLNRVDEFENLWIKFVMLVNIIGLS